MTTAHEFTTISTAALLDHLCAAVDAAREKAAGNARWLNAINAAWDHLLTVDTIEYRASDHALTYRSESGKIYIANGRCQCEAFRSGQACKHRAAARIVFRAVEARETAEQNALAAELVREAHEAGCRWYGVREGLEGARARMPEVETFAAEWDVYSDQIRAAVAESRAHLAVAA